MIEIVKDTSKCSWSVCKRKWGLVVVILRKRSVHWVEGGIYRVEGSEEGER